MKSCVFSNTTRPRPTRPERGGKLGSQIIVAMDFSELGQAVRLAQRLEGLEPWYKCGLEIQGAIPKIFELLRAVGVREPFFDDSKLKDIPNTVAGAVRAAVRNNVAMLNMHVTGGSAMMKAAAAAAKEESERLGGERPLLIGVTVLTSINQDMLERELAVHMPLPEYVAHLAKLAKESGLDGVVCSGHELKAVHEACGTDFKTVVPGVRSLGIAAADQQRVMTPREAADLGADFLVIGREVTKDADPRAAYENIVAQLS